MKKRFLALLVTGSVLVTALSAASVERDLGEGLAYSRVHVLPADLPIRPEKLTALVLDLRYATTDHAGIEAFDAWLKFRARPGTPVFVLANAETARGLRQILGAHRTNPALVTIGPAGDGFSPDISVAIGRDAERHAYDALETGSTVDVLIVENANKPRHDEAAIAHERANPSSDAGDPEADDPNMIDDSTPPAKHTASAAVANPVDRALQRAVQLHRALVALKRI